MRNFFDKKINKVLSVALVLVSILVVIQTAFASGTLKAGENEQTALASNINPKIDEIVAGEGIVLTTTEPVSTTEKPTQTTTVAPSTKATKATKPSTAQATTQAATIPFATAIPPQTPADYNAQWNAGYLVAIDNPDTTY